MTSKQQYGRVHRQAKLIIAIIVSSLLVTSQLTAVWILDIGAVFIWFFGVNGVAYILESLHHWRHKHTKL